MSSAAKNKTYLIVRLSSFGDVLLTTPVIHAIREAEPNATIHFLVKKTFAVMIENHPGIDHLFKYEKETWADTKKQLQEHFYTAIIDLQNSMLSWQIAKNLNKNYITHYKKNRFERFLHVQFKMRATKKQLLSIPERYLESLKEIGIEANHILIDFFINSDTLSPNIKNLPKNYVCIAPGAAHFTKQWPLEYYIELVKFFNSLNIAVVLLGGKDEQTTAETIAKVTQVINWVGQTSFNDSAAILRNSQIVVCNDSSIMHLAVAFKKKVLAFFGSTTESLGFYPYYTESIVLENKKLSCRPCSHIGKSKCPKGHFDCMKQIRPADAILAATKLLGK